MRDDITHRGDITRRFEDLLGSYRQLRQRLDQTRTAVAAAQVSRESADGTVRVTVAPGGRIVDLAISPRIYQRPDPRGLATAVIATIEAAQTALASQVKEAYQEVLGESFDPDKLLSGDPDLLNEQVSAARDALRR